jgi:hypothetical protein
MRLIRKPNMNKVRKMPIGSNIIGKIKGVVTVIAKISEISDR